MMIEPGANAISIRRGGKLLPSENCPLIGYEYV
jgi:hypothetical protein